MDIPARIVSLVPSLTELVWWFGLGDRLVGRTTFCVEPKGEIEGVQTVGGTKNPKVERIIGLAPDLVIANREENRREDVEALQAAGLRVVLTDPNTVAEALAMVEELGTLLGCEDQAGKLVADTTRALGEPAPNEPPRVFVAIWKEPLLGLGSGTYGHDLLERAGAVNVLRGRPRYPQVTLTEVAALRPGLVLLPDEPYPFKESDAAVFEEIAPARVVDGTLLWWYGPRMPESIRALRRLLR
jgi:ABC-type Fe3+-hydroxamate transport system substrate-binding protein